MNTVPYPDEKRPRRKLKANVNPIDPYRPTTVFPTTDRVGIMVRLDPKVLAMCVKLFKSGLYGITLEATVESLLCEQLRRVLRESREN
jgi:hypothetical protein